MSENVRACVDCGVKIEIRPEEGLQDVAYFCWKDYQERFEKGQFENMPLTLNFGNSLKLTYKGRPVRTGGRVFEQSQEGRVELRKRA